MTGNGKYFEAGGCFGPREDRLGPKEKSRGSGCHRRPRMPQGPGGNLSAKGLATGYSRKGQLKQVALNSSAGTREIKVIVKTSVGQSWQTKRLASAAIDMSAASPPTGWLNVRYQLIALSILNADAAVLPLLRSLW